MLRRYPFVLIFLCTALLICSAYYLHWPWNLCADTEADYLDSVCVLRVQVTEPPACKQQGVQLSVTLLSLYDPMTDSVRRLSQQAILNLRVDSLQVVPQMGDLLLVSTRLTRPRALFDDAFDYGRYLRLQHKVGVGVVRDGQWLVIGHRPVRSLRAYAMRVRQRLVQRYADAGLHDTPLALLSALTLGERSDVDSELRQSFAAAGAAHVLAVSGLHTGMIYGVVVMLLTCFGLARPLYEQRVRRALQVAAVLIVMWAYAFVTGLSPSVLRAVVMLTVVQVGWVFRRQALSLNTLAASACICLWADPMSLFSVSFQLSFSAVLGILLFMPYMNGVWKAGKSKPMRMLRDLVTVSVAAMIGTMPVTLFYFGQVSHYFLPANLLVLPAAYLLVVGGLLVLVLAHTIVGCWLAAVLQVLSSGVCAYVQWIEHLPFATLQMRATWWMALCLVVAIGCWYMSLHRRRLVWLAPSAVAIALLCMLHVADTKSQLSEQSLAVRSRTIYYRHGGITDKLPMDGRYTFFSYDGTPYVYAPHVAQRNQQALLQYCSERGIKLWQP